MGSQNALTGGDPKVIMRYEIRSDICYKIHTIGMASLQGQQAHYRQDPKGQKMSVGVARSLMTGQ